MDRHIKETRRIGIAEFSADTGCAWECDIAYTLLDYGVSADNEITDESFKSPRLVIECFDLLAGFFEDRGYGQMAERARRHARGELGCWGKADGILVETWIRALFPVPSEDEFWHAEEVF